MAGNSIILVDQADAEIGAGKERLLAITDAAVSHAHPVLQGALTTIPGVAPLLADPFFRSMAVTILFGVAFATILPIVVVPLLYAVVFRVSSDPAYENVRGKLVQPIRGRTMGDTIHKKSRP
jgi:multidrug efflux pump subunit AcrB